MSVSDKVYERFLEALEEITTDEEGTWEDKRERLLEKVSEGNLDGNLDELLSWFPEGSAFGTEEATEAELYELDENIDEHNAKGED